MTAARALPLRPRRGRPSGSLGEVARALQAQALAAPGTARELARRALVGDRIGMYTVSRLLAAGLLVRVVGTRPAVLAAPGCEAVCLLPAASEPENPALALLGRLMPAGGACEPLMAA